MRDMTGQPAGLDFDENSDWLHTNNSYVRGTPQHEGTASKLTVLSQDRAVWRFHCCIDQCGVTR